ncbi:MAG TPA: InlB B-repeat-containing protein [Eubacteriales bacterium]|nr:InlB B-repeat-containing protein [Eubacteriales bacterium]
MKKLLISVLTLICVLALFYACNPKDEVPVNYTITLMSEGEKIGEITGEAGKPLNVPPDPTRVGFVFGGWYIDNVTFEDEFDFGSTSHVNVTLYAKWIPLYKISFISNGAAYHEIEDVAGAAITAPAAPTRENYTFGG